MPELTIGGFYIKSYEFTRSWGIEPASSSGVGLVNETGGGAPIEVGDYVVLSVLGVSSYGIVSSLERQRTLESGDEWSFSLVDNRIRLRWARVFAQWNMKEPPGRVHSDPMPLRTSALDEWSGGEVGFDQGVDFVGGIESEMGSPRPTSQAGSSSRGRWFATIAPGHWAAQLRTFHQVPRTAAQIIAEAMQGAKGGGVVGFSFHTAQNKPVFDVDANSGMSLSALIQQLADAQGLQMTMDGSNTLRFERRGTGTLVIPAGAYVPSDGSSISTEPTKVRVVGGSRLVQVNEVPLVPDWVPAWERFAVETVWMHEVRTLMAEAGPLPEDAAHYAEVAAFAREITLSDYITRKGLTVEDPGEISAEYADGGRWGNASRMEIPVWTYVNSIVFRSYKISPTAELYGIPIRNLEISDALLCAVTTLENEGETRIVYRSSPLEFYPQASAYVIAKGQPLDLKGAEETQALIRQRTKDLREVWSVISEFTVDAQNHAIRFATPVFLDGDPDAGKSLLHYPNRGQGGGEDLLGVVAEGNTYLDIVVPNPDYEITAAEVRVTLVLKIGISYYDFGSGPRWSSYHAPSIAEHLLHGAAGFSPSGVAEYEGDPGVPEPPEAGFLEILYDDGSTAAECATEQSAGLIVRSGTERSGQYVRIGAAGTNLNGAIDRVTIRVDWDGLKETVDFAKPRPSRGFVSGREIANRIRNDELFEGQRELAREVQDLRAYSHLERSFTSNEKPRTASHRVLSDVFRKPIGTADTDVRTLPDPNAQYPDRSSGSGEESGGETNGSWLAGDLVWLDNDNLPSRKGSDFGGVVVMDSPRTGEGEESTPVKYVSVASSGKVPVRVETGLPSGAAVYGTPGDPMGRARGTYYIGRLAHSSATPEAEGDVLLALVELSTPTPAGRFKVIFSHAEQRLYVREGSVAFVDMLSPGSATPEFPLLAETAIDTPAYWDLSAPGGGDPPENAQDCQPDVDYSVFLILAEQPGYLDLRESASSGGESGDEEAKLEIATIRFKEAGEGGGLLIDDFKQLWESDVIWPKTESSSSSSSSSAGSSSSSSAGSSESSSSGGSSGGSSGSGDSVEEHSSEKSTAIVRMPWHGSGYGAMFVMEAAQVLFEFVIRDLPLVGPKTEFVIDPRHLFVCEKGSISICGSPCGDLPHPVGAVVHGCKVTLRASADPALRPNKVTFKLTGIRKGFKDWDMPARSRNQFIANEAFINSAYPPE